MPISEEQIDAIEKSVVQLQADHQPLIGGLRELFPGVVFIRCDASDMEGAPFRSGRNHQLYLIERGEMCIQLTDTLATANGVVVTELD